MRRKDGNIKRKEARVILINGEGKYETEQIYVRKFLKDNKKCSLKFVSTTETDPFEIVNKTILFAQKEGLELDEYDKAYCFIDTDNKNERINKIIEAIRLANDNNVRVIVSSPEFEYWILLHFKNSVKYYTKTELIAEINSIIPKYKKGFDYSDVLFDKIDIAVNNAKKIDEKYFTDKSMEKRLTNKSYSFTDIYKFIEEINNIE